MPFTLKFRELLDDGVQREFEQLCRRLREFLLTEHNEDGTHLPGGSNRSIGEIAMYAGSTAPAGWLLCDGALVSRATYRALLGVIGTAYGAGDNNTTFGLPDSRGKFLRGKTASGAGSTLGSTGGSATHSHSIASGGSHSHAVDNHSHSVSLSTGTPNTTLTFAFDEGGPGAAGDGHTHTVSGNTGNQNPNTNSQGSHDHGGNTGSGNGEPPWLAVNAIIFTGVGV